MREIPALGLEMVSETLFFFFFFFFSPNKVRFDYSPTSDFKRVERSRWYERESSDRGRSLSTKRAILNVEGRNRYDTNGYTYVMAFRCLVYTTFFFFFEEEEEEARLGWERVLARASSFIPK